MDKINVFNILKIQKHKYFDDNYVNNQLKLKTQLLMLYALKHRSKESLILMNNTTFRCMYTSDNLSNDVSFSNKMIKELESNPTTFYTAFHNHPNDSTFSIKDLIVLIQNSNLNLLILCTNSCKYCAALYKTNNVNGAMAKRIITYINNYVSKNKLTGYESAESLIEVLSNKNLLYLYRINYRA